MTEPATDVHPYIPQFFWKFWLSDADPDSSRRTLDDHRVHIYDVFNNTLSETRRVPAQTITVFQDFLSDILDEGCQSAVRAAEQAFMRLENEVERILADLILRVRSLQNGTRSLERKEIPISNRSRDRLLRYFVFLRYRNSKSYESTIDSLTQRVMAENGATVNACHAWHRVRRRALLSSYHSFLHHELLDTRRLSRFQGLNCWNFCRADICVGVAAEGCQYVLPETCFATLDEDFSRDMSSCHLLFPVMPTICLYILGTQDAEDAPIPSIPNGSDGEARCIDVDLESASDVHLRNASLLQTHPSILYFSSLTSVVQAISSYDVFRWIPEHLDYSRLKQRARQKATLETVTKTLLIKGSVVLVDLTDEVTKVGQHPVFHGGFADVWKGVWTNSAGESRVVALKFLRQCYGVAQDVREKVLRRLKAEVIAWYRLQHPNIAPLYGVIQSANSMAMVSPWCKNGTIMHYLEREDVQPDRLALLLQVASGASYLHNMKPVVVHGDLRGTNILISDAGTAVITDFGLSTVIEELSLMESGLQAAKLRSSGHRGSTRWMAPELFIALVDDEVPQITTESDVYSFGCVCLEVATGYPPYAHRWNDPAVTVDIMRGVKPSRGAPTTCKIVFTEKQKEEFWEILNQCWDPIPMLRPSMASVREALATMAGYCT
ncbi:kinase-like domain-containing protein [Pisolithus orientalis]|uniref:kinase-like domain-containing protein n=2 Tax=Pisolithus orientalis TaxID=936130 RepID=UPI00222479ED|nr:kinase-like domain-containing protein [Pisolithus orientalis]KAI6008736.1 kinase-like domain-containing protein [Pisolithus orientalis]